MTGADDGGNFDVFSAHGRVDLTRCIGFYIRKFECDLGKLDSLESDIRIFVPF